MRLVVDPTPWGHLDCMKRELPGNCISRSIKCEHLRLQQCIQLTHMTGLIRIVSRVGKPFNALLNRIAPTTRSTLLRSTISCSYSTFSRPTGRRSNVKDSVRKKETSKVSNRQCNHLKESCICVLLANQT